MPIGVDLITTTEVDISPVTIKLVTISRVGAQMPHVNSAPSKGTLLKTAENSHVLNGRILNQRPMQPKLQSHHRNDSLTLAPPITLPMI
jgi:hypothetical protein